MEILDNIPLDLDAEDVVMALGNHRGLKSEIEQLVPAVKAVARPKAIYEVSYIDGRGEYSVCIGGVTFTSRVLRVNLDKVERVFPHIVTCGRELDDIAVPPDDLMKTYCLDTIKEMVLRSASKYVRDYISRRYALGQVSMMSPGALEDWPITQQRLLFSIFGNVEEMIGVRLTEDCLMVPIKSVSGISFETEVRFESCQLCPREVCHRRRARYDPELARRYGVA